MEKSFYEFGPFRLDVNSRVLMRGSEIVPLTPKAFDTLLALVERRSELVGRKELMRAVWPDVYVEENNLNSNIHTLRRALGEEGDEQRYIATVPRRGYRFVAEVKEISAEQNGGRRGSQSAIRNPQSSSQPNGRNTRSAVKTLAVLPFRTMSSEGCYSYLGLGLADALITRLSNLRQIIVRPTSAVSKYRNQEQDPMAAGRELNVEMILDGSIQQAGERIRVTVQLVSVASGVPLWAGKFDESFTDIFTVEDDISARVAEALTLQLADEEREQLTKRENAEAYQFYLQGHYFWNQRTECGLKKSIEHFNRAIALDPQLAIAYVGLANAYALLGCVHGALQPRQSMPQALAAALKALELDDRLADAHAALGLIRALYDWDWPRAELAFHRALEINPSHVTARHWLGLYLAWTGRLDEAIAELHRAQQLDPFSPIISANAGWAYYAARRYDEAIERCRETIETAPNFYRAHVYLGWAYAQTGDFDAAIAELQQAAALAGGGGNEVTGLGYVYARAGKREEARQVIAEMRGRAAQNYVSPYAIAAVHAGLNETDETFACLDQAYEDRSHWLVFLAVEPKFDCLHSDTRFAELLGRIGLTGSNGSGVAH